MFWQYGRKFTLTPWWPNIITVWTTYQFMVVYITRRILIRFTYVTENSLQCQINESVEQELMYYIHFWCPFLKRWGKLFCVVFLHLISANTKFHHHIFNKNVIFNKHKGTKIVVTIKKYWDIPLGKHTVYSEVETAQMIMYYWDKPALFISFQSY